MQSGWIFPIKSRDYWKIPVSQFFIQDKTQKKNFRPEGCRGSGAPFLAIGMCIISWTSPTHDQLDRLKGPDHQNFQLLLQIFLFVLFRYFIYNFSFKMITIDLKKKLYKYEQLNCYIVDWTNKF